MRVGDRFRYRDAAVGWLLVASLFCFDDFDYVIMAIAFDDIFQNDISVNVLKMDAPTRDFRDVRAIDGLFYSTYSVESRFGEASRAVAVIILKLGKRFQECELQFVIRKFF